MTTTTRHFECQLCHWRTRKWVGRCGQCQAWDALHEISPAPASRRDLPTVAPARPVTQVGAQMAVCMPTGVAEFDRVLGGGLIAGAVVLLAGEPGIGKSTLLLQVLAGLARSGRRTLYLTGEESAQQVAARAGRVGAAHPSLLLAAVQELPQVAAHVQREGPEVLVVDSVQTLRDPGVEGVSGGPAAVRACAAAIIELAKQQDMAAILVGHVTKDGAIAGPRTLEHLVDVVLSFEGDRAASLRLVRAVKNRYGTTDEVGCFEMGASGMTELTDPSDLFRTGVNAPGCCLTVTLEGHRPIVAEVQALVIPTSGHPRRTTVGMDGARMAVVQAVLERRMGLALTGTDTYLSSVGGLTLREPAADLAAALALFSCAVGAPMPRGWLAVGELGLAGDLRLVPGLALRLAEAARLGFTDVVAPAARTTDESATLGLRVHRYSSLADAVAAVPWNTSNPVRGPFGQSGLPARNPGTPASAGTHPVDQRHLDPCAVLPHIAKQPGQAQLTGEADASSGTFQTRNPTSRGWPARPELILDSSQAQHLDREFAQPERTKGAENSASTLELVGQ